MEQHRMTRRDAVKAVGTAAAAACLAPTLLAAGKPDPSPFEISLAQWSLHRALYAGELDHLDFAAEARTLGIGAVEYVNAFFKDKATDDAYLAQMNKRANDAGVRQLLIMCDGEGDIGHPDEPERAKTVDNHRKWLHAAKVLGCHSIRVNAASKGTYDEQQKLAADGLRRLCDHAEPLSLNVLVENHGGLSSNGAWLAGVMKMVDHPRVGTLPDFGNFCMDWSRADEPDAWYDRYQGVAELMPYAKAVSAKSYEFDAEGNERRTDYPRMMAIVKKGSYHGYVGIEYEGDTHPEREGIRLTKALLERIRTST